MTPKIEWGDLVNNSAIAVSSKSTTYSPCDNINVSILSKNTATEKKYYRYNRRAPLGYASISIQTPLGTPATQTSKGMFYELSSSNASFTIDYVNKDEILALNPKIPLNLLFDMTLEGQYTIKAESYLRGNNDTHLTSIPFYINIEEVDDEKRPEMVPLDKRHWHTDKNTDIAFSLTFDRSHYEDYGPVYLQIAMKNLSSTTFSKLESTYNIFDEYELVLFSPGQSRDFSKLLKDEQVENAELTFYGKKLSETKAKNEKYSIQFKPNDVSYSSIIVLNRIFDMSLDGIYGLSVTGKLKSKSGNEIIAISEKVSIRIGTALTKSEIELYTSTKSLNWSLLI